MKSKTFFLPLLLALYVSGCVPESNSTVPKDVLVKISDSLKTLYKELPLDNGDAERTWKGVSQKANQTVNHAHGEGWNSAHVYGEIEDVSTERIMEYTGASDKDVLYDLGCGRGRFLLCALMMTPIKKAVGIELNPERAKVALAAKKAFLEKSYLKPHQQLEFYEQDMLQADISDATLIVMDSVLFSDKLIAQMANKIAKLKDVRFIVMVGKGFASSDKRFELVKQEHMPMSWNQHANTDETNVMFFKPVHSQPH